MRNILGSQSYAAEDLYGKSEAVIGWVVDSIPSESRILHVGCGFGWLEEKALERNSELVFDSIEITETDLAPIRSRFEGHPNVTCKVASVLDLPFEDATFQFCIFSEVLEHIPKGTEFEALREIRRVLVPGGKLLLTTPAMTVRSWITDPAAIPLKHRHYKITDIRRYLENAGFSVDHQCLMGAGATVIQTLDMYISKWVFRRKPMMSKILRRRLKREWSTEFDHGYVNIWIVAVNEGR